ncbi:hypothetical protein [Saccharothrix lopnurensis]|uniref:NADPH-dependent reductive aminase-like C-terminal domain-containing protein n=1 Tax=Saccharothrix lopnurensis TaxID=1670621 RepID=A0ABW1P215_9PSEU
MLIRLPAGSSGPGLPAWSAGLVCRSGSADPVLLGGVCRAGSADPGSPPARSRSGHPVGTTGVPGVERRREPVRAQARPSNPSATARGSPDPRALDADEHPGDRATTTMMGATADHVVGATGAAGLDTALPGAVRSPYRRAVEAGHGRDGWTALLTVIRGRTGAAA